MESSQERLSALRRALMLAEQRQRAALRVLARAIDEADRATEELRQLYDEIEAAEQKVGQDRCVHRVDVHLPGDALPLTPERIDIVSSRETCSASSVPDASR
jgi:hypothetical protein